MSIPTVNKLEPAFSICERLGGKRAVARALKLDPGTLSRWCSPIPVGTGGSIPQRHWANLLKLAKKQGVQITLQELANLKD